MGRPGNEAIGIGMDLVIEHSVGLVIYLAVYVCMSVGIVGLAT